MARDCGPHKIDPGPSWTLEMHDENILKTKRQEFITKPFTKFHKTVLQSSN